MVLSVHRSSGWLWKIIMQIRIDQTCIGTCDRWLITNHLRRIVDHVLLLDWVLEWVHFLSSLDVFVLVLVSQLGELVYILSWANFHGDLYCQRRMHTHLKIWWVTLGVIDTHIAHWNAVLFRTNICFTRFNHFDLVSSIVSLMRNLYLLRCRCSGIVLGDRCSLSWLGCRT